MKKLVMKCLPLAVAGLLVVPAYGKVAVVAAQGSEFSEAQIRGIFLAKGSKENNAFETTEGGAREVYYAKGLQKDASKILATRKQLELTGRAKNRVEELPSSKDVCESVAKAPAGAVGIVSDEHACDGKGLKVLFTYD